MSTVKRIYKNIAFLSIAEIVTRIFSFFAIVYLARILEAEGFGMISFAQAIMTYILLLSHVGLTIFGQRESARNRDNIGYYLSNILGLRLIISFLSIIMLSFTLILVDGDNTIKFLVLLYSCSAIFNAFTLDWLFIGLEKMTYVGLFRIINSIIYVSLILTFISGIDQIIFIPIIFICSQICGIVYLIYSAVKHFKIRLRISFNLQIWKDFLIQSLPMGMALMLTQIYYYFDTILIKFYHDEVAVGYYNAAYKIIIFFTQTLVLYIQTIFPLLSKYFKESQDKLVQLINNSVRMIITFTLPIGLGGTVLAPYLMVFIFGENYKDSILPFQILIWSFTVISVSMIYGHSLLACNLQKKYLLAVSIGTVVNVVLNLVLIPNYALIGAAVATVLTEFSVLTCVYYQFQKFKKIRLFTYFPKPLIAGGMMVIVLNLFKETNALLLIPVGIIIYIFFMLLIRGFTYEEISILRKKIIMRSN